MNINWYPGHMVKTKRQIEEDIKLIDIVLEMLDARIPASSKNPDIDNMLKGKPRIILLNKCDLADEKMNAKWLEHYKSLNVQAISTDSSSGKGTKEVLNKVMEILKPKLDSYKLKGLQNKTIKVVILGIPNVGKSSFINKVANKTSQKVENRPGVTRQKQWIKISKNVDLLDTPGVLWPKFESEDVALNLACTGTIKDEIIDITEIAINLISKLKKLGYSGNLVERYKLSQGIETKENTKILEDIGKKRGALIKGGEVDMYKAAGILLDEFRKGRLGRITLELTGVARRD